MKAIFYGMKIGIFYKRRKTADFAGLIRTYTSEVLNIYDVIKVVFDAQSITDFFQWNSPKY